MAEGVDVLLTDKNLPDVGGLELAARAREGHECEVIVITGYGTLESAREALVKGAFDFIAKPFKPKDLRTVINKAALSLGHNGVL